MAIRPGSTINSMSAPKRPPADTIARYGTGMRGMFAWMRERNPKLFSASVSMLRSPGSLKGLGADPASITEAVNSSAPVAPSIFDKIRDTIAAAAQTYLTTQQVKNQQKILDMQLKRAQAGLAPLDIDMSRYGMVPTAQVGLTADTRNLLIFGGLAAVAAFVFLRK